jgi:hypothetical protein
VRREDDRTPARSAKAIAYGNVTLIVQECLFIRPNVFPWPGRFVRERCSKHTDVVVKTTDDLHPDRHAIAANPTGTVDAGCPVRLKG